MHRFTLVILGVFGFGLISGSRAAEDVPSFQPELLKEVRVLGDPRFRHANNGISSIRFLKNGEQVLTCSQDNSARIWDLKTGKELRQFSGSGETVWGTLVLPGDKKVLTAGGNELVTLWDRETGKLLRTYKGHKDTVFRLELMPDGKHFASCGSGKKLILWNLERSKPVRVFKGHTESVYTLAVSKDGKTIYTGSDDKTIRVWDVADGTCKKVLKSHKDDVNTIALSPDGKTLASCGDGGLVKLWDVQNKIKEKWSVKLEDELKVIAFDSGGTRLAVSGDEDKIRILNVEKGKVVLELKCPGNGHWAVRFSMDGKYLYSAGDGVLYKWAADTGKRLFPPPDSKWQLGEVNDVVVLPGKRGLISTGDDGKVRLWAKGKAEPTQIFKVDDEVESLDVSPDGSKILVAGDDQKLWILDGKSGKQLQELKTEKDFQDVAFGVNGRFIVCTGYNKEIVVLNAESGSKHLELLGHTNGIDAMAVSESGYHVATGSDDHTIRIWSLSEGVQLCSMTVGEKEDVEKCCFLGGKILLASCEDDKLRAWRSVTENSDKKKLLLTSREAIRKAAMNLADERWDVRECAVRDLVGAGKVVLSEMKRLERNARFELAMRIRQVREGLAMGVVPTIAFDTPLDLKDSIKGLIGHPDGKHWVAVVKYGVDSEIVIGSAENGQLKELKRIKAGRSPNALAFSKDGKTLYAANQDSTISVFQSAAKK